MSSLIGATRKNLPAEGPHGVVSRTWVVLHEGSYFGLGKKGGEFDRLCGSPSLRNPIHKVRTRRGPLDDCTLAESCKLLKDGRSSPGKGPQASLRQVS